MKKLSIALIATLLVGGCNNLAVQDQNSGSLVDLQKNPTPVGIETAAQGLMFGSRADMSFQVILVGSQGREGYSLDPSDPGWRNVLVIFDNTSFYAGSFFNWRDIYRNIAQENVIITATGAVAGMTDAQKAGIIGFTKTFEAYDLLNIILTRYGNGAVIDPNPDVGGAAGPVVDSATVFARINTLLDDAATSLASAGGTFAIKLTPGFAGFDTPANFLKFNRALRARTAVYIKDYATALTALGTSGANISFMDTTKSLTLGTYHVFTTNSGDQLPNPLLYDPVGRVLVASDSLLTQAQKQIDGVTPDARFVQKTIYLGATGKSFNGFTSHYAFNVYPANNSPIPIIRNEDLILLRAEAEWFAGSKLNALAYLNYVRRVSGNLPPTTVTIADPDATFVNELLYNRRYSLLWEGGHRWVDLHRFGLLNTLPTERATDHVFSAWPVPSDECNNRSPQPAGCTQPLSAAQTIK